MLVDVRLNGGDGIELAAACMKLRRVPMIVISAYSDAELIKRAGEAGVFGYLVKPIEQGQLAAQLEVAVRRFRETEQVRLEKEQLAASLETRKLVERAKGVLQQQGLSEDDAYKLMQRAAMDRSLPMAEVARLVLEGTLTQEG